MKVIIVEDTEIIKNKISLIAKQVLKKRNLELKIELFDDYSKELKFEILKGDKNIYILDIELPTKSGFDIARQIRFEAKDWKSIIVIASAYDQKSDFISSQLSILTYISKFVDFNSKLSNSLDLALDILLQDQTIKIRNKSIHVDEILYIQKEKSSKYSFVKTFYHGYRIRKSLSELQKETNLEKIRKDLLINKKNTILVSKNEIVFRNNIKIN